MSRYYFDLAPLVDVSSGSGSGSSVYYIPIADTWQTAANGFFYGQDLDSPGSDASISQNYGNGASPNAPSIQYNGIGVVPADCTLEKISVWWRPSNTTADHELSVWKLAYSDDATTQTWTQLGTDINLSGATVLGNRMGPEVQSSIGAAVSAGDIIAVMLKVNTGGAATINLSGGLEFKIS